MDAEVIKRDVERTYDRVKSLAGWTVDKNVVLTITSYYVTTDREFDAETLNKVMDTLKEKTGWFSPLRGNFLPLMAAFLSKPGTVIEEEVNRLFIKQRVLRAVGFRNTIHSYLAALLLTDNPARYEAEAKQAKKLYDAIKKQHFFLTSDDDYAYAVLLGNRSENPFEHAKSMRTYYDELRKQGFRAGNELQWMSQVMTYVDIPFDAQRVTDAAALLDFFKRETKIRPIHYPMLGFLTVFNVEKHEVTRIIELTHALEEATPLKWKKEMALSMAIGYVMHELTEHVEDTQVSFATSIELVLQAQQAIIAATVAAMVSSSATNSSNS